MEQKTMSAKTKKDKRVQRTEKAIKLALTELMKNKDLSEITVSELAKKANINRKTFYFHYPNIQAVFEKIEDDIINNYRDVLIKHKSSNFKDTFIFFTATDMLKKNNYDIYANLFKLDCSVTFMNKLKNLIKEISLNDAIKNMNISLQREEIIMEFLASGFVSLIKLFYSDKNISKDVMVITSSKIVEEVTNIIHKI